MSEKSCTNCVNNIACKIYNDSNYLKNKHTVPVFCDLFSPMSEHVGMELHPSSSISCKNCQKKDTCDIYMANSTMLGDQWRCDNYVHNTSIALPHPDTIRLHNLQSLITMFLRVDEWADTTVACKPEIQLLKKKYIEMIKEDLPVFQKTEMK